MSVDILFKQTALKYLAALFLLSIIVPGFSQTYSYVPMPDTGAVWMEAHNHGGTCDDFVMEAHRVFTNGSLLYLGNKYTRISRDIEAEGFHYYGQPWWHCYASSFQFINYPTVYLREDSNKRVYCFLGDTSNILDSTEYLLYDFSLLVGDTLKQTIFNQPLDLVIDSIDTVNITGGLRKRFWVNTYNYGGMNFYIEGIGGIQGITHPLISPFENSDWLTCFSLNSSQVYSPQNDSNAQCHMAILPPLGPPPPPPIGINDIPASLSIAISYSGSELIVENITNTIKGNFEIGLFDFAGRLLVSKSLTESHVTIPLRYLSRGVYFIRIANNEGFVQTQKFISY